MKYSMQPIENILPLASQGVISLTGGGGKTSLMFHLAKLLVAAGKKVLTTTTTKIFIPAASQSEILLVDADPHAVLAEAASFLEGAGHVTAAAVRMDDVGKLKGFLPETICLFKASGLFDWIIVEADGSAQRPLKAPAKHEPVIPANTNLLIGVIGLDVLGRPLTEELVFRSKLAGKLMSLEEGDIITECALSQLIANPLGLFKGAPQKAVRTIFLNKADDLERLEGGRRIAALLRQSTRPVAECLIVGQALESIRVHACFLLGEKL
jgi:probable selenium-dependent hydroxylase accessory protein YqeC